MTDAALVDRVRAGDSSASAALVNRYHADCWRFAYNMLGDRQDAEDATQETFLRVFRALRSYDERERFRPWLFRILANQCRTSLLQRKRRARWFVFGEQGERLVEQAVGSDPAAGGVLTEVEEADNRTLLSSALQNALSKLDVKQREAFLLKHGEGLEYEEMAQIVGASIPALKMRVKRACDALRPLISEARNV